MRDSAADLSELDLSELTDPELVQVTQDTLDRIEKDRAGVPVQVSVILAGIKKGLLNPDLQVNDLLSEAGCDKNASTRFAEKLGIGPREYMTLRRMDIAIYALAETDLKIWQIAMYCGYSNANVLSDAFQRLTGQRPTAFRKAARASDGRPESLAAPADLVDQEESRRALAADPETERGLAVAGGLGPLHDQIRAYYRALDPPGPYSEPAKARALWQFMALSTSEERQTAVETHAGAFETPALFNRLCTEAIAVGERDDVLGLELAVLAVRSLDPVLGRLDRPLGLSFFARAHAVAGNAMRRSGMIEDAVEYFATALRALEAAGPGGHPLVGSELFLYLCTLEIQRDNFAIAADYLAMGIDLWKTFLARLEKAQEKAQEEPAGG